MIKKIIPADTASTGMFKHDHASHTFFYVPIRRPNIIRFVSIFTQKSRDEVPVGFLWKCIHSFIPAVSIAPLQVLYPSEALPTTARILYRSFTPKRTGNCR